MNPAAANPNAAPALQYGEEFVYQQVFGKVPIPRQIDRCKDLSDRAKRLYQYYAWRGGQDGLCIPNIGNTTADDLGWKEGVAWRATAELQDYGLIGRFRRHGKHGWMSSSIVFLWHRIYDQPTVTEMPRQTAKERRNPAPDSKGGTVSNLRGPILPNLREGTVNTPPSSSYENEKNPQSFESSEHLRAHEGDEAEPQTADFADWNEEGKTQNAEPIRVKNPEPVPQVLGDSPEARIGRLVYETTGKLPDPRLMRHMTESAMKRPGGTLLGFCEYAAERVPNLKTCPRPSPGVFWEFAIGYSHDFAAETAARERKAAQAEQLIAEKQPPKASVPVTPGCGCTGGVRLVGREFVTCHCEVAKEYRRGQAERKTADEAAKACTCKDGLRSVPGSGRIDVFECQCEAAKEYRRGQAERKAAEETAKGAAAQ